ncbi:Uncharacterised protein [uncultured archaeon]|nr:Uncharacterised protein [uncultured archaeon]
MNNEMRGPDDRKRAKKPTEQKGNRPKPSTVFGKKEQAEDLAKRFREASKSHTKAINRVLEDSGIDPKEADY